MNDLRRMLALALSAVALSATNPTAMADWGSIEGRFVAEENFLVPVKIPPGAIPDESLVLNSENLGVANVVVFLKAAPAKVHPDLTAVPTSPVKIEVDGHRFRPHVVFARTGQPIQFTNSDPGVRNVHTNPVQNVGHNFQLKANDQLGVTLNWKESESLPLSITSDIHPFMRAYCVVKDHPYVAVTDNDGMFQIENLPAGEHSFRVWHERHGYIDRDYKVTVTAGQRTELPDVTIPVEKLKRP